MDEKRFDELMKVEYYDTEISVHELFLFIDRLKGRLKTHLPKDLQYFNNISKKCQYCDYLMRLPQDFYIVYKNKVCFICNKCRTERSLFCNTFSNWLGWDINIWEDAEKLQKSDTRLKKLKNYSD